MKDKTGRLIIKVIYVAFALIIMVFSSIVLYGTAKGDHILSLTSAALKDKNYNEILSLYAGIYYEEPVVVDNDDKIDLMVNPSYVEKTVLYDALNDNNVKQTHYYHKFLKSYTFFIFNSNFVTANKKKAGSDYNDAGVKFILDKDGEKITYKYSFIIDATVNTTSTFDTSDSVFDYELNYKRDIVSDSKKYGFYNFVINSNTIEAIEEKTGGNIIGFNITDSLNKDVFESDFEYGFDFDEPFFQQESDGVKEAATIETIYNDFIPYYDSYKMNSRKYSIDNYNSEYNSKSLFEEKNEKFNSEVKQFMNDVKSGNVYDSNIKVSKSEKEIITNSVIARAVWRTIGIEALVLVVIIVIYILLFHFQQLRDFIFRNDRRTPIRPKIQNVEPNKDQKAKFNYNQSNTVIDAKPTEVKEEKIEQIESVETEEKNENNN